MDRKVIMGVAAVAGIGLLLYMRKSGDQATLAGSASMVGSASAPWSSQPIVINATTKPLPVSDAVASSPAPSSAPSSAAAPAPASVATWGGAAGNSGFVGIKDGKRFYSDGSSAALGDNELDLYKRGILGTHTGGYGSGGASAAPSGGAVWGA